MRSGNPVLKESTFLDLGSGAVVSRDGEAMTLNGTVNKTGFLLLLTVLTAAFAWNQAFGPDGNLAPGFSVYVWGGAIGGLVIALVTAFKKEWSPVTAPLYALVEGFFLGAISALYNHLYEGIVMQAVMLTHSKSVSPRLVPCTSRSIAWSSLRRVRAVMAPRLKTSERIVPATRAIDC